tara:strand:+ start:91 stop:468 length:378 start_codon:yes stop_codon:yes gene_type:complete
MITFNNNKKFDLDLEFGQIREERIAKMLEEDKIEVKTERGMWRNTGNIAIEYQWNGKPSGIASTDATWWWHVLEDDGEPVCDIVFRVDKLKDLARDKSLKRVNGGDDGLAKLILLPLSKLFERGR